MEVHEVINIEELGCSICLHLGAITIAVSRKRAVDNRTNYSGIQHASWRPPLWYCEIVVYMKGKMISGYTGPPVMASKREEVSDKFN